MLDIIIIYTIYFYRSKYIYYINYTVTDNRDLFNALQFFSQ